MSKPEDASEDVWQAATAVVHRFCGCAPGRRRANGTSHHEDCWSQVIATALAIRAERERCAKVVEGYEHEHQIVRDRFAAAIRKGGDA